MTWKQFKELLEKQDITDKDEIVYIDISGLHIPKVKWGSEGFIVSAYKYENISTEDIEKFINKSIEEIHELINSGDIL